MSEKEKEILAFSMPDDVREDIEEFIRLRNITRNDETTSNIVEMKMQFQYLSTSLKCAVMEGSLKQVDADEIKEECSYW